ncbi:acyl-coenzyme A thioesterase 13-like [Thrips palmi]|uniref:Acyl-coenzyme A thioesterase 13-like n=1 Tax=Thrips palmi TaxID=161013 RepID=A0A6P9ABV0_THRPL|nr:acyl-coenzyme A thioesterase 13-like [Thrips palmi]
MAGGRQIIETLAKRISSQGFDRVLSKLKVVSGGNGKCVAEMKVEEEHQNYGGTLHGGMTATLVDIVSTLGMLTHEKVQSPGVTVDLHVSYLKAARVGEEILVEASTIKAGKTLAYLHVDIKKKDTDEIIARGSHTKFIGTS